MSTWHRAWEKGFLYRVETPVCLEGSFRDVCSVEKEYFP